jgi:hypothetical protein
MARSFVTEILVVARWLVTPQRRCVSNFGQHHQRKRHTYINIERYRIQYTYIHQSLFLRNVPKLLVHLGRSSQILAVYPTDRESDIGTWNQRDKET